MALDGKDQWNRHMHQRVAQWVGRCFPRWMAFGKRMGFFSVDTIIGMSFCHRPWASKTTVENYAIFHSFYLWAAALLLFSHRTSVDLRSLGLLCLWSCLFPGHSILQLILLPFAVQNCPRRIPDSLLAWLIFSLCAFSSALVVGGAFPPWNIRHWKNKGFINLLQQLQSVIL